MFLLNVPAPPMFILVAFSIIILVSIGGAGMIMSFYKKPPPGKVMVVQKYQSVIVTKRGAPVLPVIWSHCFVHAEVEEIQIKRDDGSTESVFVCLKDDPESAILAMNALGDKPVQEIKRLIASMLKNCENRKETLAKIGYTLVT